MSARFKQVRRQVLRRVRYATNAVALRDNRLPPEGPYDTALTNGLLAIVSEAWPGEEVTSEGKMKGKMKSARGLIDVLDRHDPFPYMNSGVLLDGLEVTQPARHGRSDDEFAVLRPEQVEALLALDEHPALEFLDAAAADQNIDQLLWLAFVERAETELPQDPKDRIDVPDPDECDECWRPTFLPSGWDMFGGTNTGGACIACGYEVPEEVAYDRAVREAIDRAVARPD